MAINSEKVSNAVAKGVETGVVAGVSVADGLVRGVFSLFGVLARTQTARNIAKVMDDESKPSTK